MLIANISMKILPSRCPALPPYLGQGFTSFARALNLFNLHTYHPYPVIISALLSPRFFSDSSLDRCFNHSGSPTPYLPAIDPVCSSTYLPAFLPVALPARPPSLPVLLLFIPYCSHTQLRARYIPPSPLQQWLKGSDMF